MVAREHRTDVMTPDGILIPEGVDEDVGAEDCALKNQLQLVVLRRPDLDSCLSKLLANSLQEERGEPEKLQGERMERLTSWLQATPRN